MESSQPTVAVAHVCLTVCMGSGRTAAVGDGRGSQTPGSLKTRDGSLVSFDGRSYDVANLSLFLYPLLLKLILSDLLGTTSIFPRFFSHKSFVQAVPNLSLNISLKALTNCSSPWRLNQLFFLIVFLFPSTLRRDIGMTRNRRVSSALVTEQIVPTE